jgi:TM2 domain-containing membrane protein YozV
MGSTYYVRIRGRTLGPYTLDAIRQATRRAQVGRLHEVSVDGATWAPATEYPEIFERVMESAGPAVQAAHEPIHAAEPVGAGVLWHYTRDGVQQQTPIEQRELVSLVAAGDVRPDDLVWCETMPDWAAVSHVQAFAAYAVPTPQAAEVVWFPQESASRRGTAAIGNESPIYRQFVGKKTAAGVCALLLGVLGIHKFMLGLTTGGLTMLILCFLIIPIPILSVIALAEAVIYLSKTDEQFFRDYAVDKKQWF